MLRNLTDIFPGLRWTASNNGRTAVAAIPLAGPIELSLTSAGSIAMRLPEDGLFKKELTLSPDSAVVYLARWAAEHHTAVESAMGLRPRSELAADLAALRERMRWVPVGERLPMDLLNRNVMDAQGNVGTARQRLPYAAGIWDKTGSETLGMITHWKDLPEGFDTGLCASCCGTGLTDLHYCDGVIFQPRLCPCGCPRPLPAAPEVPQ